MAKKIELNIPKPCHEEWSKMNPLQSGRFCGQCQKQVYDFSAMTDAELIRFFEKRTAPVCGRLHQDQLQRAMLKKEQKPLWAALFFRITLPAFLLSIKAGAQKEREKVKTEIVSAPVTEKKLLQQETVQNEKTVKGQVLDEKENPIPNAAVSIKGGHNQTLTDAEGKFMLKYSSDMPVTLLASSVGYRTVETIVQDSTVAIRMYLAPQLLIGEMVIVGYINPKPAKQIPLLTQLKDTLFQRFSVYPNPVKGGREVTIQGRRLNKGKYTASLLNASGQAVFTQEVSLFTKGEILKLAVPVAPPGVYTLCLMNGKGTSYTEKIKVE